MGDQKLRHMQAVIAKQALVSVHEVRLADGGQCLERGDIGGALRKLQWLQPGGDGTAADDDDGVAGLFEQGDGLDELAQLHGVWLDELGA
jgi:hypothetical protein